MEQDDVLFPNDEDNQEDVEDTEDDSTINLEAKDMDLSKTKVTNASTVARPPGLLDDFRKCIAGYDDTDVLKEESVPFGLLEAKYPRGTGQDVGPATRKRKHEKEEGFREVTRYNILDGTISHHTELSGLKAALLRQDAQATPSDSNVLRALLQQSGSLVRPRTPDVDSVSAGSPSQDPESPEKFYPCKVCKKNYVSKSSLRKHFCMPGVGPSNAPGVPSQQLNEDEMSPSTAIHAKDEQYMMNGSVGSPALLTPVPSPYDDADKGDDMAEDGSLTPGELAIDTEYGKRIEEDAMGPIYSCPLCSMTFRHTSQLMRHRRTHTNERPFECVDCHQAFRRKCHLKRHWQRIHSGEKPFKCAICGKAFSDRDHQRQHETIHGPETYPCFHCRCVFPSETYLIQHLSENPDCKAAFARDGEAPPKRTRGKHKGMMTSYKCGLCFEQFKKLRQIQTHQRVRHHDVFEKKYKCNLCGKGFDLISDLTHHRNNHAVRSKLDVDKNGDTGYRPQPHHHHHHHHHQPSSAATTSKAVQNKAELLQMLQQLERRIQQQQQQVKKIESQQEEIENEDSDGEQANAEPQNPHSQIRYILETSRLGEGQYGRIDGEGAVYQNGHSEARATAPVSPRSEAGAMDLSLSRNALEGGEDHHSPHGRASTSAADSIPKPSSTLLDLMTNNRHKCEQCGISFLLYSEFRAHRKRHERARVAIKQEPMETSEYLDSNPDADKSLCRDCCNQNDPTSSSLSTSTSPPHSHISNSARCFHHQQRNTVAKTQEANGQELHYPRTRSRSRSCDMMPLSDQSRDQENKARAAQSPSHDRVLSCEQCLLLKKQLVKERNDKKAMRIEIERLREALVSFAEAAANHASPLRSSSELMALFSKHIERNMDEREIV
ncbi:zinc finger protein 594-like isoform X2 [Acanthaster planci]|uniref:Zinc finger protein 594-like isoform X2 n=1 Tax=Acanthaster planci TaxID=133434 RepID=A0A8B7XY74_ACAPL|nr:zinc finger protein 594-like isoform X2 [Acanthaster planci]